MSSGVFDTIGYQASYDINQFHPIRIQPETTSLSIDIGGTAVLNDGVPGNLITNPISARANGTRRTLGLNAARVRLTWVSNVPNLYDPDGVISLPLLNAAIRAAGKGATATYLGGQLIVLGVTPEYVN